MQCGCRISGNIVSDICDLHMRVSRQICDEGVKKIVAEHRHHTYRIAALEAALHAYHDWHLNLDDDVEGYLDSKLFEQVRSVMPELAEPKE